MEAPCNKKTDCPPGPDGCPEICIDGTGNLSASLPADFVPLAPMANGYHRIVQQPQCNDENCGQRIQIITMQGHEIAMMDTPSGANRIKLTTSDNQQHISLDELNKMMWFSSGNHKMIFADAGHDAPSSEPAGQTKFVDPNQMVGSTYQLMQTENKHQIWLADSPSCSRIHSHTIKGHEVLLLDGHEATSKDGKIQITTHDKLMQIVMDVTTGDIEINNFNPDGDPAVGEKGGKVKIYAQMGIEFHTPEQIWMNADLGVIMNSCDGPINGQDSSTILFKLPAGPGPAHIPAAIKPSVLTDVVSK